jgi:hypothetical protein
MTSSEQAAKQVEILLASYKATKDEISRRSALSWTSVGGYLLFVLGALKAVLDGSDWKIAVWTVSVWLVAILAYLFYVRELREIFRLSELVRIDFESRLRELCQVTDSRIPILPEGKDPKDTRKITAPWQTISDWAVFLGGPLAVRKRGDSRSRDSGTQREVC